MKQYIVFKTNSQSLAIGIEKVDKIIEFEEGKKIPEPLPYMLGVIEYNGRVLPIVDLGKRLYNRDVIKDIDTKIIVVNWKEKLIGLAVDDILGIKSYGEEFEEPNNDIETSKEYLNGFIKLPDDIIIVLNVDELLDKDQEEVLIEDLKMMADEKIEKEEK
ncbi:MAG: chemotaxis protein CheW [Tissierella sp.]|uniref:chemotaxis protein CheW n=1 Tax=Tissierella sp. TaxID=41274 RepID=UPI003F9E0B67